MTYNYSDPAIFALVGVTHYPVEIGGTGPQPPQPQILVLVCGRCYNPWPCPTILDYRTFAQANGLPASPSPSPISLQDTSGRPVPPGLR
jgi:hypothetical protein